ncbi:helix-turn-helix transcriptional regulator [Actinomadura craniellae]|uniref:Helix-turn-helix transcriptional regulator n=1 Tax=Actinomadura craniellae TaxID=2231787 RepID=A0A365H8R4_9ACTN|nr:helix-turn-helix transcriptional regulator [Actinomadura craniellae]RAY15520.1 helix-turn-helix transcriptional regulator [Actinomadura craniellae]
MSTLVGRSADLSLLAQALADAPGAVLLGGEAGVGKTRLIREFGTRADGARVLVGGCVELGSDGGLPFAPFTAVLRRLVRELGTDGVTALLPGPATGLARLLPEFGDPGTNTAEDRARLFELVLTLLERLAEDGPLALVIEDAHWADRSTHDLLAFLVRNLDGPRPVLLVVTYRTDELYRGHRLRTLLAELDRIDRVRRRELGRLTRTEVADLVRELTGTTPEADQLDRVYRRSEGNPLFVESLVDCDGGIARELPESLRDLLLAAVRRLPEETQDLLRTASTGDTRLDHGLLAAVTGLDDATLTRSLRPAVEANVLTVDGDGYVFRHALIREAVHRDLLPGEHTRLHTRFAEALTADPALVPRGRAAAELALHWHSAHNTTWALISAWQAATEAFAATAHAEALNMLSRVLELWDLVPDAAERIGAGHVEVQERAVAAADLSGEHERGIKLATAALREVERLPDADRWRARLLEQRGRMAASLGRYQEGVTDLEAAVRGTPAEPASAERATVLVALARGLLKVSDFAAGRAAAEEAVAVARQAGDAEAEAEARCALLCSIDSSHDPAALLAEADRIEEVARRAGTYSPLLRVYVTRSHILEGTGRHSAAAEVARAGIALAGEYGLGRTMGTSLAINQAEPLVSLGRWDEATTVLRQALDQDPPRSQQALLWQLAGEVATARGELGQAAAALAAAEPAVLGQSPPYYEHLLPVLRLTAALRWAEGDRAAALAAIEPMLADFDSPDRERYLWPGLVEGARICAGSGDRAAFAAIEARAKSLQVLDPVQEAHRLTFTALAAEIHGRPDPAAWDAAAAAWEVLEQLYPLARALADGAAAALPGDRAGAAERLRRAAEVARQLGARPLGERIAELSRRARPGSGTPLGLTPRELEVLRLVAEGRANREIAAALFISAKTVSVHVSNMLAKLGVASRGEAAATAHRLRLFDPAP